MLPTIHINNSLCPTVWEMGKLLIQIRLANKKEKRLVDAFFSQLDHF